MYQQNNKQDFLADTAKNLYGDQREKEEEEKSLRNSLLNELGDKLTPAQTLYSSVDELKKMRDEMNAKKSQDILQVPLPENKIQQSPSFKSNDNKKYEIDLTHKPKLLDKIPTKKEKENSHTLKQEENQEIPLLKGYLNFDENRNDNTVTDDNERFNKIMKHVYVAEGGFVDDPDDRGGRTNKGVTQRAFDAYNKKNGLPLKDVKDITTEEATEFYRKEYWIASGADKIEDKNLAYMHFDTAVNHGVGRAKKLLEQSGGDLDKYLQDRKTFYGEIVKNRPSQQKYYNGWMNRINNIEKNIRENVLD